MQFRLFLGENAGDRRHGGAVRHGSSHCQHHAEAVEHRHLYHHSVSGGQVHAVADSLAVVDNIVMGKHYTLGESRSARGVLHIADIVLINSAANLLNLAVRHFLSLFLHFHPSIAALHLKAHSNHVFQHRETLGVKLSLFRCLQFGAQLSYNARVVAVLKSLYHNKSMSVGLFQQVFSLVITVTKTAPIFVVAQKVMYHAGTLVAHIAT